MFDFSGSQKLILFILMEWKLLLILTVLFALYFYATNNFDFFEKRGIPHKKPTILIGNLGPRLVAKKSFHQFQLEIYNSFDGAPIFGFFEGRRPVYYVRDPELIKAVTVRDFDHFVDRTGLDSKEPPYLKRSLLNLKGAEWKGVRSIQTPTFSSSRLRNMLPLIESCNKQLVQYFKKFDGQDVEMKDAMGHFTLEVIGVCAFGIKCDALNEENAHFIKMAERFNYMPKLKRICILSVLLCVPSLFRMLNISFFNQEACWELMKILRAVKRQRVPGDKKNDYLQLLIDAAEKERNDSNETNTKPYLDDDTIDAQSLLFLIAGYETSSTLLSFAMHVLVTKPEIQEKLRAHIQEHTEGKEISYELLSQMPYLEGFLLETLRLYPPVARIDRKCTKTYTIPDTTIQINVGDIVSIPCYAIHKDPKYYPEPEEFRPERFMGDEKKERPSHLFLAFGAGPRNCIGLRFAMISAKLAMVTLLKNFKFSKCAKTEDPIQFDKSAMLIKAGSGIWVRIESLA